MTRMKAEKIVPDTSILISGVLSDLVEKEMKNVEIIIPSFVLEELQAQASKGTPIGFKGLDELKKIRELAEKKQIKLTQKGRRQTLEEIKLAKSGRIDGLIVDVALKEQATLYTSDLVQALVSEARGIKTRYFKPYEKVEKLKIEEMLTPDTLSLHLKEGVPPLAKRGKPGKFKLVKVREEPIKLEELEEIIHEIMNAVRYEEGFLEIGGKEASIVQLGNLRIAITRPPFSDGVEVSIIRPIMKLTLDDYKINEKLKERIRTGEGIILAGPPGSGKSTFAASLAEFYNSFGKIVKTLEQPRDLQVKKEITQYSKLKGDFEKTAELLLLVRPDYTIFDEIRTTKDFLIFKDMRLAGIGMVGVIHASSPIDAIQRFIGRIDLGMIPHILDTLIFIEFGEIKNVYTLSLAVRIPTGMFESDLIRPVVEVRDFFTDELEYEIYSYGEEKVVFPVKKKESPADVETKLRILKEIEKFDKSPEINVFGNKAIVMVDNNIVPRLIGKNGKTIQALEKKLGISLDVLPKISTLKKAIDFSTEESGSCITFKFSKNIQNKPVNFYVDNAFVFSAIVGRNGRVRINKDSEEGKKILSGIVKKNIKVFL